MKIYILSPIGHHRHPASAAALEQLFQVGYDIRLVEVYGYSEVARARCRVASRAIAAGVTNEDMVFWMDADMVLNVETFRRHLALVEFTRTLGKEEVGGFDFGGFAVSGRYVQRKQLNKIAAAEATDEHRQKMKLSLPGEIKSVTLHPLMVGMGCLMLTGRRFLQQAERSRTGYTRSGNQTVTENLVCCPRLIEVPGEPGNVTMLGEDFDYCSRIPFGAWMAEFEDGSCLDYGHLTEHVAWPTGPFTIVDDRGAPPDVPTDLLAS